MNQKTKNLLFSDVLKSLEMGNTPSFVKATLHKEFGWGGGTLPYLLPDFVLLLQSMGFTVEDRIKGRGKTVTFKTGDTV